MTMSKSNQFRGIVVAAMMFAAMPAFAADEDPAKSVELRLEGQCDANNGRLWLINNHQTRAIVAALRWSLANSKRIVNDQFRVAPASKLEIGCAARADIVSATFAAE